MTLASRAAWVAERRVILIRGAVQGVGFRPFVWRLAAELHLDGFVRNDVEGVVIEAQGEALALERFVRRLTAEAPALACIDAIEIRQAPPCDGDGFFIAASLTGQARTGIAPDAGVCDECLGELFDPSNRRYRYAFINCTQCGPRYTITARLPYDRPNTSMRGFTLCEACAAEYRDPAARRFHAQPNACSLCGPSLTLRDARGSLLDEGDTISAALARLRRGEILAVKGLGGYHLVCDARNRAAVLRLREGKARERKPLAVMVAGSASLAGLARLDAGSRALLEARERPIVLLPKAAGCDAQLREVAPAVPRLGVMLPYAPLQYLLFHEAAGRPAGTAWMQTAQPMVLVVTSANPGGEPLVTAEAEALRRLAGIADGFVDHDREILVRCDDSVVRGSSGVPAFVRRGRGFTPVPIKLAAAGPSVLATGAYLKNAVCITRGDEAFLSQHVGDLDNAPTCRALEEVTHHLLRLLDVEPECIAHDLHPDLHSTRFAAAFAAERGLTRVAVQHHHAHVAAVAAEHGVRCALLGLALDGFGLGADGGFWGGELLRVESGTVERLGHLRELPLPGGDRAACEPWRMGAAALHAAGRGDEIAARFGQPAGAVVAQMLERRFNCPPTSSAGRWFDAAAALLRVAELSAYEGQAPMLLEGLAERHGACEPYAAGWRIDRGTLDLLPLLMRLLELDDACYGASVFHATMVAGLAQWVSQAAHAQRIDTIALGGGCFVNAVLSRGLRQALEAEGLRVLEAAAAPANDGGLALGQAAVAMLAHGG